ncbi:LCP family protein [Streptomyces katsurahamanus]|uniref:LytR family transcriptional regulator n=1 Tax=Streptomyces katsurahamanus TaxID=2577098 RepID=A0ABW9NMK0_9ACTN|nr:LCP family protein [Streptomyces katsurahamanus]MQS34453.1 LytR family transcriptional regulator [Streptomyces katsurahamanus]
MDTNVTDSAGTPIGPADRAGDEGAIDAVSESAAPSTSGAAGTDKAIAAAGTDKAMAAVGTLTAGESAEAAGTGGASRTATATAPAATTTHATAADTTESAEPAAATTLAEPPNRTRHWVRWAAFGTSLVVLAAAGAAWWSYRELDSNITTDTTAAAELETFEQERPTPIALDAQNILILGSDTRAGEGNRKYGRDDGGSQRSDTTILLHIAADRQSATAMSIPRDLMAEIPNCRRADGTRSTAQFAQFNGAFTIGGAACTIRTVEKMTGVRIDHHMILDFSGFKSMVDAIGGVEVCLKEPIDDADAHLKLDSGRQKLDGEEALGYVRARKSIGDGSDTERMERQQQFLGSLVKKVQSNGVLLNPAKLYPLLEAATKSLTTDPGLDSLKELYDLAQSVRSIPTEKVQFLTVPRQPHTANRNRDELVQPAANRLFGQLREDTPITVLPQDAETESGLPDANASGSPSPATTFTGTNAAVGMCK